MALSYTKTAIALGELAAAFELEGDPRTAKALRHIAEKPAAHMRLTNMLNDPNGLDKKGEHDGRSD